MHTVVKWPNIFLKSCCVYTARFLKYVCPFYNVIRESKNILDEMVERKVVDFHLIVMYCPCKTLIIATRANQELGKNF